MGCHTKMSLIEGCQKILTSVSDGKYQQQQNTQLGDAPTPTSNLPTHTRVLLLHTPSQPAAFSISRAHWSIDTQGLRVAKIVSKGIYQQQLSMHHYL